MEFPLKTKVNKLFKTKILQHLYSDEKKELQTKVDKIVLSNTLRQDTLNVEKGKNFVEIFVFDYWLNDKNISDKLITAMEKIFPKYLIHILHYKNDTKIVISYKEKTQANQIKVVKIYHSEWQENIELKINGLDIDSIFENFISQIAGNKIEITQESTLKEVIEKSVDVEKLQKKITALEKKINNEKQFNKQIELKKELKELKSQMEAING